MRNDAVQPDVLDCPKCRAQMRIQHYPENDAYRCDGCMGLWLPLMAHEQLEERADEGELQVDLFAPPPEPELTAASPVEAALAAIQPDQLSPREALDALYQLKGLLGR